MVMERGQPRENTGDGSGVREGARNEKADGTTSAPDRLIWRSLPPMWSAKVDSRKTESPSSKGQHASACRVNQLRDDCRPLIHTHAVTRVDMGPRDLGRFGDSGLRVNQLAGTHAAATRGIARWRQHGAALLSHLDLVSAKCGSGRSGGRAL